MSKLKSVFNLFGFKSLSQNNITCVRCYSKIRLEKIGKAEESKQPTDLYISGQTFIHKAFKYRGIIVYSWPVKVHDYALENQKKSLNTNGSDEVGDVPVVTLKLKDNVQTYYQVLVDSRDCSGKHFNNKNLSVRYFPDHTQKVIEIPDMDYVAHDDIIPYQSTVSGEPVMHPLFNGFFDHQPDPNSNKFILQDEVKKAHRGENSWMCVSDVYKDTTDDLQVTVIPFYMGSRFGLSHIWRYSIRIDYHGKDKVTVLDKVLHLTIDNNLITNASTVTDCTLDESMSSYQFYDNISFEAASAQMWGEFSLERADDSRSRCTIPVIKLNVLDNKNLRLSITDLQS